MVPASPDPHHADNQWPLHGIAQAGSVGESPVMSDSELFIRRAFEHNPANGYELLFKRYYGPLCSHAARFVYDRQVAEDIVIDVLRTSGRNGSTSRSIIHTGPICSQWYGTGHLLTCATSLAVKPLPNSCLTGNRTISRRCRCCNSMNCI